MPDQRRAGPDQRWVCAACGKHTELGADRDDFPDVACVVASVLCEAERGADGLWVPVKEIQT